MLVHLAQRLVNLHECTIRHHLNHTGLNAVLQHLTVGALQPNADPIGNEVRQRRQHNEPNAPHPGHGVQRHPEVVGEQVVASREGHQEVEGDPHHAQRGPHRHVPRPLQQVMVGRVPGNLRLNEWIGNEQHHHEAGQHCHPERPRHRVITQIQLPCRHDTSQTVRPQHVNVGLRTGRHLRRIIGTQQPNRVDRGQPSHECQHAGGNQPERGGLDTKQRQNPHTHHIIFGATRPGELGVLLVPHQRQVSGNQAQDNAWDNQHVGDIEAVQHQFGGEIPAEDEPVHPGADDRQAHDNGGHDAQAHAGQQVVRQGVAHEALGHAQQQQHATDNPVGFTRAPERPGEEDAQHVHGHGHHEHERSPVVHLADKEPAAHLEG